MGPPSRSAPLRRRPPSPAGKTRGLRDALCLAQECIGFAGPLTSLVPRNGDFVRSSKCVRQTNGVLDWESISLAPIRAIPWLRHAVLKNCHGPWDALIPSHSSPCCSDSPQPTCSTRRSSTLQRVNAPSKSPRNTCLNLPHHLLRRAPRSSPRHPQWSWTSPCPPRLLPLCTGRSSLMPTQSRLNRALTADGQPSPTLQERSWSTWCGRDAAQISLSATRRLAASPNYLARPQSASCLRSLPSQPVSIPSSFGWRPAIPSQ